MRLAPTCVLAALLAALPQLQESALGTPSEPPADITWTTALGEVVFPHALHVDDLGIGCEDCHHETSAASLSTPHPDYFGDSWTSCSACHGQATAPGRPRACSSCHPATPADIADETSSSKVVIHRSCWECHEVGQGLEASQGCRKCHPPQGGPTLSQDGGNP